MIPLALYIHIPWCVRKCPYCDFNSHAKPGVMPEAAYIDALLCDLQQDSEAVAGRSISSIFIGGGTPSLFAPESIARLLAGVQAIVPLQADAEITLEANPGTIERGRFVGYRAAGVNRVSLGVQSFNDAHLRALGRIHQRAEVFHAVAELRQAGLANFNIDLMHGLPAQTVQEAVSDVQQAIDLAPTHLSWYQLTIEPNTAFHVRPPVLSSEGVLAEIEAQGKALLAATGFTQYEVSAYSQAGCRSRHNLNYWQFGDYLGIGAGAHAKITLQNGAIERTWKHKLPKTYLDGTRGFIAGHEVVAREQLPFEFMLNALRLSDGFSLALFEARTGLLRTVLDQPLRNALTRGLLQQEGEWVRPTELGARFLNDVLEMFQAKSLRAFETSPCGREVRDPHL